MNRKLYHLIIALLSTAILLQAGSLVSAQYPTLPKHATKPANPQIDNTLDLCMSAEPDSLYYYDYIDTWQTQVFDAIYDGPIDTRSYSYQPVIFESVPTLDNGGAITETVTVTQGDMIVDSLGSPVSLEIGTSYFPSGCYGETCAVIYSGGPVEMEHMLVKDTLLPDLTWSDGEPLTSQDMLYSFNLNADPATPAHKDRVERTSSFITTTLTQTVWTGLPGYFPFDYSFIHWIPLPEHIWSDYTPTELISAPVSSRTPMGWGPYVIDEWVSGSHISMHKNPFYFRLGEGLPHFDTLVVHFGTESAGIMDDTCEVVFSSTEDLGTLLKYDDAGFLEVAITPGITWEHLDFGIQSSEVYTGFAALTGAFQDVRVRQAFAYCIDRQAITDATFYCLGTVANALIPDYHPYFPLDAVFYPFDPIQGNGLLEAAGWTDSDEDGLRDKDGYEFSITLKTTDSLIRQKTASLISAQMEACGIEVIPIHMSPYDLFIDWPGGPIFGRKFDLSMYAWLAGYQPSVDLYVSWNIPSDTNPSGQNDPGYANPEYDTASTNAFSSIKESDRLENYRESVRIFTQDLPVLPLFVRLKYGITAPQITGFSVDPTESTFWNLEELSTGIQGIVPPEGGVLSSFADTTNYTFPTGTFTDTVVITHTPLSPMVLPGFGELTGAGHFFNLEATLDGQPIEPSQPYTMTIGYTDAELGFVMEHTLGLYYWNGGTWVSEPNAVVDMLKNTIVATPDHFSNWAVLGVPYKLIYVPIISR